MLFVRFAEVRRSGLERDEKRQFPDRRAPVPLLYLIMAHKPSSRVRTVSTNSEWDIYVVRSTPAKKWLGTVEATDVHSALSEAVWRFDVKEPNKLIAVRRR